MARIITNCVKKRKTVPFLSPILAGTSEANSLFAGIFLDCGGLYPSPYICQKKIVGPLNRVDIRKVLHAGINYIFVQTWIMFMAMLAKMFGETYTIYV